MARMTLPTLETAIVALAFVQPTFTCAAAQESDYRQTYANMPGEVLADSADSPQTTLTSENQISRQRFVFCCADRDFGDAVTSAPKDARQSSALTLIVPNN
jgi:hypothetical protein